LPVRVASLTAFPKQTDKVFYFSYPASFEWFKKTSFQLYPQHAE
jgi:hypothetical protein